MVRDFPAQKQGPCMFRDSWPKSQPLESRTSPFTILREYPPPPPGLQHLNTYSTGGKSRSAIGNSPCVGNATFLCILS